MRVAKSFKENANESVGRPPCQLNDKIAVDANLSFLSFFFPDTRVTRRKGFRALAKRREDVGPLIKNNVASLAAGLFLKIKSESSVS